MTREAAGTATGSGTLRADGSALRLTSDEVLAALAESRGAARSEKALARVLAVSRDGLGRLRRVLQELAAAGLVEQHARGWRLARRRESTRPAADGRGPRTKHPAATEPRRPRAGNGARASRSAIDAQRRVGVLVRERGGVALVPLRDETPWRIALDPRAIGDAQPGDVVEVVQSAGRRGGRGEPRVSRVLGRPGDPDADFEAVVWHRGLRVAFPEDVLREADEAAEHEDRIANLAASDDVYALPAVDRTTLPFVTIDPATARDHDDAVHVEPLASGGSRLWVAIADVAHAVPERSALDREALRRGNSLYFPDRAIPMLPHRLSGDACSLRPGVPRRVRVVVLDLASDASVLACRFEDAWIASRARLAYEDAAAVMEGRGAGGAVEPVLWPALQQLAEIAARLAARRREAGAIDFEIPAAEVVLGEDGRPTGIVAAERTIAHRAIEEAMLVANRAVAEALVGAGIPCIHRVHEAPDGEKLATLGALLARLELLGGADPERLGARDIAAALRRANGRPESRLVNVVALRAMKQARYAAESPGHFALAFEHYVHFTSPIRRYADLVVHRALRDWQRGDAASRTHAQARGDGLDATADRLNTCERAAVEAEREMVSLKTCVHLRQRVGEVATGTITGVAPAGLFVTLDDVFADGLVHATRLSGRFELDVAAHCFVERRTRRRYCIGDALRVRIEDVDLRRGWVRLGLVDVDGAPQSPRRSGRRDDRGSRSASRSRRPASTSGGGRSRRPRAAR